MESPVGCTQWVFNSLTNELTALRTVEIEDGEYAPWDDLRGDIESAVLVDGVTSIRNRAFFECSNLKSVQIGRSVKSIGDEAFEGRNHSGQSRFPLCRVHWQQGIPILFPFVIN